MKNFILFLSLVAGLSLAACSNSGSESATEQAPEQMTTNTDNSTPQINITNPESTNATASASGQKHYICPNNCEGSGGDSGGTCPKCGTAYVHNAAFHANATTPTTAGDNSGNPIINMNTPPTAEPAQNANGVWHYTCPNGCQGGGGSAVACGKCGATLAHNTAYHQ